jgi:hypothetical protein
MIDRSCIIDRLKIISLSKFLEKVKVSRGMIKSRDYQNLLQELRGIIEKGKYKSYKAVDNILVETRWQIGERIVREELKYQNRADYGEYLMKNLAVDLGTTKQRLSEIIRFYKCYSIVRSLSGQLSWKHYVLLITITDQKERKFYENKIIINSWSIRELARQIKNNLYQNTDHKEIEESFKTKLPVVIDVKNIFKPDYEFNFSVIRSRF